MTVETRTRDLAIRIATEFNTIRSFRGDLSGLSTTDKTSLVAAINEVLGLATSGAVIDDAAASTTTTYSSDRIDADIAAAIANVVGTTPEAFDTLQELLTEIQSNDSDILGILTAQALRVSVDAAQGFSAAQQTQGRENIGAQSAAEIGDTNRDFVADFDAALS